MFTTIDLTKTEPANGEIRDGDYRGYAYVGCRKNEVYQIRICWKASNPLKRHYHLEVARETGEWYGGPKISSLAMPGVA